MLGIVVVSFGSRVLLEENLARLDQADLDVDIVVVDNFRSAASQAEVVALARSQGWDVVTEPENRGFGSAMNIGVARALGRRCSHLVLLNPDVRVTVDVLRALGEQVAVAPQTLVTPRIVRPDGTPWFIGGRLDLTSGRTRNELRRGAARDGWLTGACLAMHSDLWRDVGGFDEDYFLYWEDVDLSHRCLRAGGELLVRHDLTVEHEVGGTQPTRGQAKSSAYSYFNCRNRLLFATKHLPRRAMVRWLVTSPAYAREILLRGGRRQLIHSPRPVANVVLGTIVGSVRIVAALLRRSP